MPDIPHAVEAATSIQHKWINVHFGLAPIYDYTWPTQDEESVEQLGVQSLFGQRATAAIGANTTGSSRTSTTTPQGGTLPVG